MIFSYATCRMKFRKYLKMFIKYVILFKPTVLIFLCGAYCDKTINLATLEGAEYVVINCLNVVRKCFWWNMPWNKTFCSSFLWIVKFYLFISFHYGLVACLGGWGGICLGTPHEMQHSWRKWDWWWELSFMRSTEKSVAY